MTNTLGLHLMESDETLVISARSGDTDAYAELWHRHATAGLRAARHYISPSETDDLVAEAYTLILQRIRAGGGPDGPFRPYLYVTIRNLAGRWSSRRADVRVETLSETEDPESLSDHTIEALDRSLTSIAFRSLPERWRSVLWYTVVEQMEPHEVAPLLGMTPNAVAALSYRAREGLRRAWLQAHVSDVQRSAACTWVLSRLGDHSRRGLTPRQTRRVKTHLAECSSCGLIAEEIETVSSGLATVLIPLALGGTAGGTWLAAKGSSSAAIAAATPPVVSALTTGGTVTVAALSSAGTTTIVSPTAFIGAVTMAVAIAISPVDAVVPPSTWAQPLPVVEDHTPQGTHPDANPRAETPDAGSLPGLRDESRTTSVPSPEMSSPGSRDDPSHDDGADLTSPPNGSGKPQKDKTSGSGQGGESQGAVTPGAPKDRSVSGQNGKPARTGKPEQTGKPAQTAPVVPKEPVRNAPPGQANDSSETPGGSSAKQAEDLAASFTTTPETPSSAQAPSGDAPDESASASAGDGQ
ncbi:sigma-70 family RNA polymerase sigma factor [Luethyella okanaganae]|uniref:Sigma-70 family RNA polymerase sigma factor n=1 Tax=Luethyella okanaganae TaxID=69372 RepID=A0ABW1VBD2_9MICO